MQTPDVKIINGAVHNNDYFSQLVELGVLDLVDIVALSYGYEIQLNLVPNPDILQELGDNRESIEKESGCALKLIGFAAETGDEEELLFWARDKLNKKKTDLIVGNFAGHSFGKDTNRVWLLDRTGRQEEVATADKELVAERIIKASLRV